MSNVALIAGSSQQGKHRRASVDSNCVPAAYLSSPDALKLIIDNELYIYIVSFTYFNI